MGYILHGGKELAGEKKDPKRKVKLTLVSYGSWQSMLVNQFEIINFRLRFASSDVRTISRQVWTN